METNSNLGLIGPQVDILDEFIRKVENEGVLSVTETREAMRALTELQNTVECDLIRTEDVYEYINDNPPERGP